MTDRYHTLVVVLESDIREDDAEPLMNAIRQMRQVLKVTGIVSDLNSNMAEIRAKLDCKNKLLDVINDL